MSETTITAEPGTPYLTITREFDAPVEQVFNAHIDEHLAVQWLGPRGYEMTCDRWDMRDGGAYQYTHTNPEDESFTFRGSVHSVKPNESIVQTFEFLGYPGPVDLEWMTFEDLGDERTRIVGKSVFQSVEHRDAMIASGMESGVREGYERLDELLAH